jgi:hypothetical protein
MRVRSYVGGSGDDSEQSDSHESGNPSMLGHGNPFVLEKKWHGCTNNNCALSEIERPVGRRVRRISERPQIDSAAVALKDHNQKLDGCSDTCHKIKASH